MVEYCLIRMMCYKKFILIMVYILGFFVLCYILFLCVKVIYKMEGYIIRVKIVYLYVFIIVFFNSFFNFLVYCWCILDIWIVVKEFFLFFFKVMKRSLVGVVLVNIGCFCRSEMSGSFIVICCFLFSWDDE